jgi:glycerol uptake facilitator-like aquaporin
LADAVTAKLVTEVVGTFIFLSVIALSGPIGPLAPLAIGAALMVMVYMGGHISGLTTIPRSHSESFSAESSTLQT